MAIAVLDVGKTNKKVVIYSDEMELQTVRRCSIGTVERGGLDVEDVERVVEWFFDELRELGGLFPVRVVSVSAHGATAVCIGEDGRPSVPVVAYTNEVPEEFHADFWRAMGSPDELQRVTATVEVKPLINLAKMFWFLKKRWPKDFQRTKNIIFFPQYFGYRLTGCVAADITYAGCHSYLWDFEKSDWSHLVDVLEIRGMLPERPGLPEEALGNISGEVAARTGLSADTMVTLGVHDSNSSLIPYLISQKEDFVLNSTGTWCVAMHPEDRVAFQKDEIGSMVFYNLSYIGRPVKTSILLGGLEYQTYTELLMRHHRRNDWPSFKPEMYADLLRECRSFILPTVLRGTGPYPESPPRVLDAGRVIPLGEILAGGAWPDVFNNYEQSFALANLSLAIQSRIALERVGLGKGTELFIEGGFRENRNYLNLLCELLPDNPIFLTSMEEATSFGAGLCAKSLLDNVPVSELGKFVKLDKEAVSSEHLPRLNAYVEAFIGKIAV